MTSDNLGSQATVIISYASPLPANSVYYKYNANTSTWSVLNSAVFDYATNSVTLTLTDGGAGDDDGSVNGTISDPSGPGAPPAVATAIPALSHWALAMLALLIMYTGVYQLRRMPGRT